MRPRFKASTNFVPLLRSASPLHSPRPYSCSRKAALRYQIVSSPARQELPRARVRCPLSLCALRALKLTPAQQPHPFASTRKAAQDHSQILARQLERNFRLRVLPSTLATPSSEMACHSSRSDSNRGRHPFHVSQAMP